MATPEPLAPSKRLRSAALAERDRLRRDLDRTDKRIAALRNELAEAERNAGDIRRQLALLAQLAHDEEQDSAFPIQRSLRAVDPDVDETAAEYERPVHGYLRGADIRLAAVRILASTENPAKPIHYGEWYDLVTQAGYGVAGRDPQATFLTQVGRSPIVKHTCDRGFYALDLDAPRRLSEQLRELHVELVGLHQGQQTIEAIATVRERRAELTSEYAKVERELEEAAAALGLDQKQDDP
jgi:chromosome segregation ATPase